MTQVADVSKGSSDAFALQEIGVILLLREGAVGRCGHANLLQLRWKEWSEQDRSGCFNDQTIPEKSRKTKYLFTLSM